MRNQNSKQKKISMLICLTYEDPVIKKRLIELLQLSSFERRFELNIWLEKLRQRKASENLCNMLLILFDDRVAEQILKLIYNTQS